MSLLDKVVAESAKVDLSPNCKKTMCMVVTKQATVPECNIFVEGIKIQQVDMFNYLGSLLTSDGKCDRDKKKNRNDKGFI